MEEKYSFGKKKLMTPGPVPLPDYVKDCLRDYECHHRTKDFTEVLARVFSNLKKVFQTQNHCYLLSSTGTGAMEAAWVHCIEPGDCVLTINTGKFGERWAKLGKAFGSNVEELKSEWGKDIDLSFVESKLSQKKYKALAFQACETSTGALLPTKELCALAKKHGVLSIVDGITALGAAGIPMDDWGVDVFIGGSQKAFMLPTGMSFLSLSPEAEKIKTSVPKYYWDLAAEKKSNLDGKTRYSTPTHLVLALDLVLDEILRKGIKAHFEEMRARGEFFRKQVQLPLFPETPSPSLTCLALPESVMASDVLKQVSDAGYVIIAGQDHMKEKILRIGHMGHMSQMDLQETANAINKALK